MTSFWPTEDFWHIQVGPLAPRKIAKEHKSCRLLVELNQYIDIGLSKGIKMFIKASWPRGGCGKWEISLLQVVSMRVAQGSLQGWRYLRRNYSAQSLWGCECEPELHCIRYQRPKTFDTSTWRPLHLEKLQKRSESADYNCNSSNMSIWRKLRTPNCPGRRAYYGKNMKIELFLSWGCQYSCCRRYYEHDRRSRRLICQGAIRTQDRAARCWSSLHMTSTTEDFWHIRVAALAPRKIAKEIKISRT